MTATVPETEPAGRRERKKLRTREALVDAAFELFAAKGFEATTVEEIADAVDVSSRTFFRYFASKEDVALTFQEEQHERLLAALAARPADEPVVTAMRRAMVIIAQAYESGELGFDTSRFECIMDLMTSSPQLMAGSLEHMQKKQASLTRVIAERMGVDPATDLRPHIVATMSACSIRTTVDLLHEENSSFEKFSTTIDEAFTYLEEGINYPSAGLEA